MATTDDEDALSFEDMFDYIDWLDAGNLDGTEEEDEEEG